MNKLVTMVTVAALAVGMSVSVMAQQPGPKGGDAKRGPGGIGGRFGRMAEMEKDILAKLNLNADQKKKIEALNKKTKTKMEALMKEPGEMKDKREKFREINQNRRDEMNKILTPAQQKKYKELWQEKVKEMRPPGREGAPTPPKGAGKAGNKGKA